MDSDAWRPFDPVDVKRQVGPERSAATTGRVSSSRRRTRTTSLTTMTAISLPATANTLTRRHWSDYTWLDVSVVTFITLTIDAGA